ncbi:uncharacterized protein LOC110547765 [Meriones unguiculatus]|uniref:uncharacterized protein LOC110547765 n=1 Tax=Meriones unguiculatus TaxID=10047 RepID=UPI00293E529D|nr:uncharacterized protein LOC110547765 [Meriones unguiculatus]
MPHTKKSTHSSLKKYCAYTENAVTAKSIRVQLLQVLKNLNTVFIIPLIKLAWHLFPEPFKFGVIYERKYVSGDCKAHVQRTGAATDIPPRLQQDRPPLDRCDSFNLPLEVETLHSRRLVSRRSKGGGDRGTQAIHCPASAALRDGSPCGFTPVSSPRNPHRNPARQRNPPSHGLATGTGPRCGGQGAWLPSAISPTYFSGNHAKDNTVTATDKKVPPANPTLRQDFAKLPILALPSTGRHAPPHAVRLGLLKRVKHLPQAREQRPQEATHPPPSHNLSK